MGTVAVGVAREAAAAQRERAARLQIEEQSKAIQTQRDALLAESLLERAYHLPMRAGDGPTIDAWRADLAGLRERADTYRAQLKALTTRGRPKPTRNDPAIARVLEQRDRHAAFVRETRTLIDQFESPEPSLFKNMLSAQDQRAALVTMREALVFHQANLDHAEGRIAAHAPRAFDDPEDQRQHDQLAGILESLRRIEFEGVADAVRARRETVGRIEASLADPAWNDAIESIRTDDRYGGLALEPIAGLVPLGRSERSCLWEFWHIASGARPTGWTPTECLMTGECGMVMVLVPAARALIGVQGRDPAEPRYDPVAAEAIDDRLERAGLTRDNAPPELLISSEGPVVEVELDAYFIAKHEMTQGQYRRITGDTPSARGIGTWGRGQPLPTTWSHPVESMSFHDLRDALALAGLGLPTRAQWEHVAWRGAEASRASQESTQQKAINGSDANDSWAWHAPVDVLGQDNAGIHHMLGNVSEWVDDWHVSRPHHLRSYAAGDGRASVELPLTRSHRGGDYADRTATIRPTRADHAPAQSQSRTLGCRAALTLPASKPR